MSTATQRSVIDVVDALADAFSWPRSRPARVLLGDRAGLVEQIVFVLDESSISEIPGGGTAIVLSTPPGPSFARVGRRHYEPLLDEGSQVADWIRAERVVLDASEMLAGGRGGYDDQLARLLVDTGDPQPFVSLAQDQYKLVGFVPTDAVPGVRDAVFGAGAGHIGAYSECSWSVTGTGTFRGGPGSTPTVGSVGTFEQVEEARLEVVVPARLRDAACRAFVTAHPYEQPAFDVHVLATPSSAGFARRIESDLDSARVASRLNGAGLATKVLAAGNRSSGVWVVTTGSLQSVLGEVVSAADVRGVVAGYITPAERRLLDERGVALVSVEQNAVRRNLGPSVVERLAHAIEMDARFLSPLEFPGAQL